MNSTEKEVTYQHKATYTTINELTEKTTHVIFAFHGLGYLSRYFARYFREIPKNFYIICPQATSKYYQGNDFKYVGASWLTKENTMFEMNNLIQFLDAIEEKEIPRNLPIKLVGYSQGVSIAMRWMANKKRNVDQLIIHSGSIPVELSPKDFSMYKNIQVDLVYGTKDEYLTSEKLANQLKKANELFGSKISIHSFEGIHEVNAQLVKELVSQ